MRRSGGDREVLKQHLPSLEALYIKGSGLLKGGGEDGMSSEVKE